MGIAMTCRRLRSARVLPCVKICQRESEREGERGWDGVGGLEWEGERGRVREGGRERKGEGGRRKGRGRQRDTKRERKRGNPKLKTPTLKLKSYAQA